MMDLLTEEELWSMVKKSGIIKKLIELNNRFYFYTPYVCAILCHNVGKLEHFKLLKKY